MKKQLNGIYFRQSKGIPMHKEYLVPFMKMVGELIRITRSHLKGTGLLQNKVTQKHNTA